MHIKEGYTLQLLKTPQVFVPVFVCLYIILIAHDDYTCFTLKDLVDYTAPYLLYMFLLAFIKHPAGQTSVSHCADLQHPPAVRCRAELPGRCANLRISL